MGQQGRGRGFQLLSSIIREGSRTAIRQLHEDLFVEEERPSFNRFMTLYRQHAGLPSLAMMASSGAPLPETTEPVSFLFERVVARAVHSVGREHLGRVAAALRNLNSEAIQQEAALFHRNVNRFTAREEAIALDVALAQVFEGVMDAYNGVDQGGITLGWRGLDALTGGAQPGEVVTWVARPSVGKSYSLIRVALEAWRSGRSVLFISMEMQAIAIARRMLAGMSRVTPDLIKRGHISFWGQEYLQEIIQTVPNGPRFTLVSGNLTKSVGVVDAYIQEYDPDLVLIDAQYLMKPTNSRGSAKQWENLSEVGVEVQQMALARNKPVHQSVQFNRSQRKDEAGDLANIGGTDVVGQISALVVAISEGETPHERSQRRLELIKNREGSLGSITTHLLFDPVNFDEVPPAENTNSVLEAPSRML